MNLFQWLSLSLLNDSETSPLSRSAHLIDTAISESIKLRIAPMTVRRAQDPLLPNEAPKKGASSVFRDRPTLREMMNQYNRHSSGSKLLKNTASQSFKFDRIESIRLPSIPGKILRPC